MKYQGLNPIMSDITIMASNEKNPQHEQHLYHIFTTIEKYVRTAVPQLIGDYLEHFQTALTVEIETYLNGQHINYNDITTAVAGMLQKAIGEARIKIEM